MPSFRVAVTSRRKNGEWPIYIRMVHGRKYRLLPTGLVASDGDLHRKELRSSALIDRTDAIMKRMRDNVNAYGEDITELDIDVVARIAQRRHDFDRDFFSFARKYVERLRTDGREGTAKAKEAAVRSLRRFVERDVLYYSEMDVRLMTEWRNWLRRTARSVSSTYVANVGSLFRAARKEFNDEDGGMVRIKHDPFRTVKPDRAPQTRKKALDPYDIVRIRDFPAAPGSVIALARDAFVISFYLLGMNCADLYEAEDPVGGRLDYHRRKTRGRNYEASHMSVKVVDELLPYIERHKGTGGKLFDFSDRYLSEECFVKAVGDGMRRIGEALGIEGLTFYAARHSWATYAVNECGVDIYTVDKALCHSGRATKMTEVYIKKDFKDVDRANRRVIDFVEEAGL